MAAASTAEAVTGFPPGTPPEVTNTFLPLAALAAASEALFGINIEAAKLPEATTDDRVGGAVVLAEPVSEDISC